MKVYVITASGFCGEDTDIKSIWDNESEAQAEATRIAPDEFAVVVTEYELNGTDSDEWRR
jgi:hypothetical protein